jgi:Putative MetA-pathway of phenol degradation
MDAAGKRSAAGHGRGDYRSALRRAGFWLLLCAAPGAAAQQLEPRAYSNVPVGLNFLIAGYTYSSGGLATDPALPLDNAKLDINAPFVAYARAFDAWGKSAKFDAVLAAACLSGTAESNGVPVSRDICGGLDPAFRVTVNLFGAPAMGLAEFRGYRQDLIVGVSLQVGVPLGQYDPDRLVNLGTHRWTFRPEVGVSKKLGALTAEAAVGASLFTTNDDFFGGKRREQDPVLSAQLHLIFEFAGGSWLALNATYYAGGRTTVNGVEQNDELSNSRLGATFAWPLDRHHSIKLHASDGVSVRSGDDFTTVGVAWQYRWGAGF